MSARFAFGVPLARPHGELTNGPTALRRWREDDAEPLAELCRDPEISRWTSVPAHYSLQDARAYIASCEESVRTGRSLPLAIAEPNGGLLLGSIALMRFAWPQRRGEVGYWLGAEARGRGHATRATRLICGWGVRELGLERIELLAATGNLRSQAVAERAGFTREALLRAHSPGPAGREDMVCFGLLAAEAAAMVPA
ncbi:MAG TPA: GNAT family N-acetyltransferase [Solirubrobacteraceae bacterium]|nr:GNAT family N-acetyltransferase [Solirubrobacteraceae bacterium]